ncbi:MAG: hypothetical protein JWM76_501 [Pseudonocardiales bacterium]|nr:hypothetical protein [Pseudonocardiales bacterium]
MTRTGLAALILGVLSLGLGIGLRWDAFTLIGIGILVIVAFGLMAVIRPSALTIEREIQPPRVPKGDPAIAFLRFANRGRRTIGTTVASQPYGDSQVRTIIPRLRRGESGVRTYRLPTHHRGVFDLGPVEVVRADSFDTFRLSRKHGQTERIWVHPRILPFRALSAGQTRHLEGPTSDTAPAGNITFHRLRDYVVGDDLRMVHWRSSARTGKLVVKHNVDTSQPYTVVLLDQRPALYNAAAFEAAVDIAASVLTTSAANKAPVELRQTDGTVIGGPRLRDVTALIDHLTAVAADPTGSLREQLLALRRARGGTGLIVITGDLDVDDLPYVAALRRRFDHLVVISVDPLDARTAPHPAVRVIAAADADEACSAWNLVAR